MRVPSHKSINFSVSLGQLREDDIHSFVSSLSSSQFVVFTDVNDCTFRKMLACMTSPSPLGGAGKKVTLKPGIKVQEAAQFCTFSPSCFSTSYWCWIDRGATRIPQWAAPASIQREWRPLGPARITAWFPRSTCYWWNCAMDIALYQALLCLNSSRKLWEFALSTCPPKSSYSALATLREDGVCLPFHREDILGLMSWREDIEWWLRWKRQRNTAKLIVVFVWDSCWKHS